MTTDDHTDGDAPTTAEIVWAGVLAAGLALIVVALFLLLAVTGGGVGG